MGRLVVAVAGLAAAGVVSVLMAVGIALAVAYPNLPDVTGLADYRNGRQAGTVSSTMNMAGNIGAGRCYSAVRPAKPPLQSSNMIQRQRRPDSGKGQLCRYV